MTKVEIFSDSTAPFAFCGDCLGIVGVILFAIIWKAPADGYAKADRLLEQVKADYAAQRK